MQEGWGGIINTNLTTITKLVVDDPEYPDLIARNLDRISDMNAKMKVVSTNGEIKYIPRSANQDLVPGIPLIRFDLTGLPCKSKDFILCYRQQ